MKIDFGYSRCCTNPELPISLAGYFNRRMWNTVLDDIEVRTVVFRDKNGVSAIIQFDLLSINSKLYGLVFEEIQKAELADFSRENVLVCATHSHTCPDPYGDPNSMEYCRFIAQKAAWALKEAQQNIRTGELFYTLAEDHRFLFNRRYWMKDGTVLTNPGKLNADIVRPEGEIDPQIPILVFKTEQGIELLMTSIVNHTDTIGGCGVSADWPGVMRRKIENVLAPGAMVMPLTGCSGNINHFDVTSSMDQTNCDEPRRIGEGYADTVIRALADLKAAPGEGVKMTMRHLTTSRRRIDDCEIASAREIVAKYPDIDVSKIGSEVNLTSEDLAKGAPAALKFFAVKLLELVENPHVPEFLLTKIEFGSLVVLASLPSEPFVEIGLTLRRAIFRDKFCVITSHGNYNGGAGFVGGYIPNAWNYGRGGYETTPRSSGFGTDTGDLLIENWRLLAKE